ncbi:nuclear transcription factor Y subunit B-10-like [Panicum miliaceum]|uniref:Nuclear transcription factor Y subunit B-10-like n=1 Tax=Panicum miliaceum TaxID=4540 RepID=A0A3L6S2L0_PANMI|nr:nuclear transcription factor Y subunit B-10-like [Panicum miliaceum]
MPPERAAVAKEAMATEPLVPGTEPLIREQDRLMPVANVSRIMRHALPPYAKISDDAKEMIQDCVSEFISFVTGEANERCHTEHRKTVTAEDLVWAMNRLGFDDYIRPLNAYPSACARSRPAARAAADPGAARAAGRPWPRSMVRRRCAPPTQMHRKVTPSGPSLARFQFQAAAPRRTSAAVTSRCPAASVPWFPTTEERRSEMGGVMRGFYADEASSSNEAPPARRAGSRHY